MSDINTRSDQYNGWTNRETWAVFTWITNAEAWYNDLKDKETGAGIKAWFDNCFLDLLEMGDKEALLALQDIGSLWRVDWDAVARALTED